MIQIAYLSAEHSPSLDYETSNDSGRENRAKAILEHPDVEYYSLEDFVDAFNDGFISDFDYIAIKED